MRKKRKIIPPPRRAKELSRRDVLSLLASLSVASGNMKAAEGYLLELLAHLAFAERDAQMVFASA